MFQVDWSPSALAVDLCQIYLDHAIHRKDITVGFGCITKSAQL
jgi:hypothetical protein